MYHYHASLFMTIRPSITHMFHYFGITVSFPLTKTLLCHIFFSTSNQNKHSIFAFSISLLPTQPLYTARLMQKKPPVVSGYLSNYNTKPN